LSMLSIISCSLTTVTRWIHIHIQMKTSMAWQKLRWTKWPKSREIAKRSVSNISRAFDIMECSVETIESITKTASRMGLEECSQCQMMTLLDTTAVRMWHTHEALKHRNRIYYI
jgi:hypothetical protein